MATGMTDIIRGGGEKKGDADEKEEEREGCDAGADGIADYMAIEGYDWVKQSHPAWLEPKPEGFIPDLNDVTDLMWIEQKLAEKNLSKQTREELETMRKAALNGTLRGSELDEWKKKGSRNKDAVKSFLSSVRTVRRRGATLDKIPQEAIAHLDAAIAIIAAIKTTEDKQ